MKPDLARALSDTGALFKGHTAFRNGLHGNGWIEKGVIIREPNRLDRFTQVQAQTIREVWGTPTLVVGAAYCGAVVASFVARHLKTDVAFVNNSSGLLDFHRMHVLAAVQRVVIVDDLICTGTDVRTVAKFLDQLGHDVLGVSAWISRSAVLDLPCLTAGKHPFETYSADTCPLCIQSVPIDFLNIRE
jgi:orotate phosphoribosyltransferase